MMRKLSVEIWGVAAGTDPSAITVSTEDGERVVLNGTFKQYSVKADDLIALARILEGMRGPVSKPGG